MRRPLTSPFSWLAVGVFALLAGIAFVTTLNGFLDHSSDALLAPPPEPINVNQLLIRPFLFDVGLASFLVLPLITARAFTADRRGDAGSVLGIFAGTLVLYAVMLLASLLLVAVLFLYGTPEWGSIVSGYLGLLLTGAAFISAGLFMSSLATRAVPAGIATGAMSLVLLAATWLARSGVPAAQPVFRYFSIGHVLDDFAKGVIDSGHVASCLIIIALSLFLMRRAIESRRSVEPV